MNQYLLIPLQATATSPCFFFVSAFIPRISQDDLSRFELHRYAAAGLNVDLLIAVGSRPEPSTGSKGMHRSIPSNLNSRRIIARRKFKLTVREVDIIC